MGKNIFTNILKLFCAGTLSLTLCSCFYAEIARNEKNGEENSRVSAFINVEAWRKNENASSFDKLTKGAMLTVEGYFKPEEWSGQDGVKHNRVVLVATRFYETLDREETPKGEGKASKKKSK